MKVRLAIIGGVEGSSLCVCDSEGTPSIRVAGPKPWGGGKVTRTWITDADRLVREIQAHAYDPADLPGG